MKILFIHPDDPSSELTWSRTPYQLSSELIKLGHKVFYVKTKPSSIFLNFILKLIRFATKHDYGYSLFFRYIASTKVNNAIQLYRPDILLHFGTTSNITFLQSNLPSYLYCDYTWNLINTFGKSFYNPRPSKFKIRNIDKLIRSDYAKFKTIFCQSSFVRDDLVKHYNMPSSKLELVRVGTRFIDENVKYNDTSPKNTLLFIARDSFEKKGGGLLLSAFQILKEKYKIPFKLIFEGGSAKHIINDNPDIIINGLSSKVELRKLYSEAFALVMPSIAEPLGLVYLEALACGTPIVGLNRGALPDITNNGEYGFLVDEENPEHIADKIFYMYCNPLEVNIKTALGRNYVLENYNWSKIALLMHNLFYRDV
jgi:glycosyltransferase involved in cell wall biosynthesis